MKFAYTLIYVDDVEQTMTFYQKAFQLTKGFLHVSKQYGEMITGYTKIGFVQHETAMSHGFEYEKISKNIKPPGFEIGFVTSNVEQAYLLAISEGATPISKPTRMPWGQTISYVRDCNGLLVEICSEIKATNEI